MEAWSPASDAAGPAWPRDPQHDRGGSETEMGAQGSAAAIQEGPVQRTAPHKACRTLPDPAPDVYVMSLLCCSDKTCSRKPQ